MPSSAYEQLLRERRPVPSYLAAPLRADAAAPSVTRVIERLRAWPVTAHRMVATPEMPEAHWEMEVELQFVDDEQRTSLRIWSAPSTQLWAGQRPALELAHLQLGGMAPEMLEVVQRSRHVLGVSMTFGDRPLQAFHRQVQLVEAVAPEAVLLMDVTAIRLHSLRWLRAVAASHVPPAPSALFVIHAVADETNPSAGVWLHTHGLYRCGTLELELIDVPSEAQGILGELLNVVAARWIEEGPGPADEPFAPGPGIELVWLPWEEALPHVRRRAGGTGRDRDERHTDPSAVLFAPGRRFLGLVKGYDNVARYVPRLSGNPLLYVSNAETERMSLLAQERLRQFVELQRQFAATEGWRFLVKLGYPVDHAEEPTDREHLWFEVHAIEGNEVDATLANEPYHIARLHEGERTRHPLERLSDWAIISPHGYFIPDALPLLQDRLDPGG